MKRSAGWILSSAAMVLCGGVLGFYQVTEAAPQKGNPPPFANSVEQRMETVAVLREIRDLLKQQNALLASGQLKVTLSLSEPAKPGK